MRKILIFLDIENAGDPDESETSDSRSLDSEDSNNSTDAEDSSGSTDF